MRSKFEKNLPQWNYSYKVTVIIFLTDNLSYQRKDSIYVEKRYNIFYVYFEKRILYIYIRSNSSVQQLCGILIFPSGHFDPRVSN